MVGFAAIIPGNGQICKHHTWKRPDLQTSYLEMAGFTAIIERTWEYPDLQQSYWKWSDLQRSYLEMAGYAAIVGGNSPICNDPTW